MHFPIYDHELCLHFSCSTYVLMSFVERLRKYDSFLSICDKKGGVKIGEIMDDSFD
jgi:hypothetical protein